MNGFFFHSGARHVRNVDVVAFCTPTSLNLNPASATCHRDGDLGVNPIREKKLTNIRAAGSDEKVSLSPPRLMTLEDAIGYVGADELIEVTPSKLRLRKALLTASARKSAGRAAPSG